MMHERKTSAGEKFHKRDDEKDIFKTLYVIIFSADAASETVSWLLDLFTCKESEGGANLFTQVTHIKSKEIIVELGASPVRLLEGAETLEITKEDKNGNIKEFVFSDLHDYLKEGVDVHNLLSTAEKQRVIFEEVMRIRSMEKKNLRGYSDIKLFPGQSIIQVCINNGLITHMFPLHEQSELKYLKRKWTISSLPLDGVKNYYGESVAFYFAFICFYTWALIPPAIAGIFQTIISFDISRFHIFFSVFKMIWLSLFLQFWKRKTKEYSYAWGTLRLVNIPKLHPTFRGENMQIDPVTKQYVPVYPGYRRHFKVYCVSLPLVICCLSFAFVVMLLYFKLDELVNIWCNDGSWSCFLIATMVSILYAVVAQVMNIIYSKVATILTEWENHRTQDSYDNHRIVKLLLFEFVNNFSSMGYVAFYKHDLKALRWEIAVMMSANQIFYKFQESILPYLLQKFRKKSFKSETKGVSTRIDAILEQRDMCKYEGTYDDYLEIFMQFGYVFLFSSVFPLAAVIAVLNNICEMWLDGFKLCYVYQRPQSRPVNSIGIWQTAFEVLSLFAVMTNCALIAMSPIVRSYAPNLSLSSWLLIGMIVEHILIALKLVLTRVISSMPKNIRIRIERAQYKSLHALKAERRRRSDLMKKSMSFDIGKIE